MKKRRVEVMIETHRTWIISAPGLPAPAWCAECGRTVRLLTIDEAARLVCQTTRNIFRMVESRQLHYRETPTGRLLVCLDSVLALAGAAEPAAPCVPEILAALEGESGTPPQG